MIVNGWRIYFIKRLFGKQRRDLQAEVRHLKKKLTFEEYQSHATVKLYTAIMVAIKEKIPLDPFASHLALSGSLKKYSRVKKMGLPDRYRLFFRALQTPEHKAIFILWLGYPRKQGDKNDCYKAFTKMVQKGEFPESIDDLLLNSDRD
ncbi:type II toxin-antitoxin system YhaV family toxin [Gloeocapsopsis crepidinum LEGE 06123]|uniref:Type II toxin-antitoxin system YhaV family toxin n=1 Tax=Gloeocapsopsis crepidinum LEGE 06123 TaxID=588587 RepID=A0ABR9UQB8_9CHRO|nr:type II toxin-antitoxin system YhaV family toxin [Gloeocapsopsis crepidinum]MBE9190473.1 type II toxin-antitoxin system YhaV family toxin [Gloeocapsopsis crepidinum LEGE 06123]